MEENNKSDDAKKPVKSITKTAVNKSYRKLNKIGFYRHMSKKKKKLRTGKKI